ncbi:lipoprotein insertase outer membrane protein LolB [Psychromonas sp. 14N.309.X.WAT.B.A12]|uniref:lipoprotein insertase outer membrane protein LolB n=1 Tax=unclassified Psychromonas TaxID=2614957 RepID=UPI0025AEDD58|nr:lipoprotein insertase outer membrane protein LolB [Psychromonas sp. 14N.309.X.WAT.B.A12]MDN2664971.1 lipoprotein insertase outer membrane protein LolB [Psychromonas sp. 14N.309.X.WAT.B.A12]
MKKIVTLLLMITLTGCSQFNTSEDISVPSNLTWQQHQKQLQQLDDWILTGKLAIFLESERQTANIYWRQQGDNYAIQLTTFIGTRILQITKNEQGVEIIDNDDQIYTGQDTNALIKQLAPGLDLPIQALQQWIKGNPEKAPYQLNDQQQVSNLLGTDSSGNQWEIRYQQYQDFSGFYLPRKIDLNRDDIKLKIAVSQWNTQQQ